MYSCGLAAVEWVKINDDGDMSAIVLVSTFGLVVCDKSGGSFSDALSCRQCDCGTDEDEKIHPQLDDDS